MFTLKKFKYRHKLTAVILIFTMLPMVVLSIFLLDKIWNSKVNEIIAKNEAQMDNGVAAVDTLLSSYVEKLLYINNNFYIVNFLGTNSDLNLVGDMSFNDYLQSVMGAIKADNSKADVAIYTFNPIIYDSGYLRGMEKFDDEVGSNGKSLKDEILTYEDGKILWKFRNLKENYNQTAAADYICLYKKIMFGDRPSAIIEIRIPFKRVMENFQYEIPKGSFILFQDANSQKNMVINSEKSSLKPASGITAAYYDKSQYYVLTRSLKFGLSGLSMSIPREYIFQELKLYWITVILAFLMITAVLFLAVEFVSFFLTKRLQGLLTHLNTNVESLMENDNLQIYEAEDEFGTIGNRFYELIHRIKDYYHRITEYEFEKKILETELLQERINPHFLYNTLSTMRWICSDEKVLNAIDSLVKYYRIALNKGSSIVKISQELEMIEEYLLLQKFAYGYVFDYHIDIEPGAGEYKILKHMLQPIVENAVLHGINEREEGGEITICCRTEADQIIFEVSDNGQGMEQNTVENLLKGKFEGDYGGYGIRNVQKRMEVFYGEGYGLAIESVINKGTSVIMTIPCNMDSDIQDRMKYEK